MNRGLRIAVISTAVVLVVSAVLLYVEFRPAKKNVTDGLPDTAVLAHVDTTAAVLAGVALQKNFYLDEGLNIIPRPHPFGKSALLDLLEGNADFAVSADIPIMMAIMRGEKIAILATIQASSKDNAIIALSGKGILFPKDLQGKRIGTTLGTAADFFMDAYLASHGVAMEQVEHVHLEPEDMEEGLVSGYVDAVATFQPYVIRIRKNLGDKVIIFHDDHIYNSTFNIVAKQESVRRNIKEVRKFLRALVAAEQFVQQNPEEAQRIVAGYSGIPLSLVKEIWPDMKFAVTLDQSLVLSLEDEARWAINNGIITGKPMPNFLDYIYFAGLEPVKPEAVRILR